MEGSKLDIGTIRTEIKEKWLLYGSILALVGVSIMVGIFYLVTKVKEPVFLRNCIEQVMYQYEDDNKYCSQNEVELRYIINRSQTCSIKSISFPDHPEIESSLANNDMWNFSFFDQTEDEGEVHGRYSIHTVFVNFTMNKSVKDPKPVQLGTSDITFSDGSRYRVDLGKIVLIPMEQNTGAIREQNGVLGDVRWPWYQFELEQGYQVCSVSSYLYEDIEDVMPISLSKEGPVVTLDPTAEKNLNETDRFELWCEYKELTEDMDYDQYKVTPVATIVGSDGTARLYELGRFERERKLDSAFGIYQYLQMREK